VESSPCLQAKNQGCEILFSRKKEWNTESRGNVDEPLRVLRSVK
jgi:hypothetical protein